MNERVAGSAENSGEAAGRSPSEMLDLPPLQRGIVQLVLRSRSISHAELLESMKTLPGASDLSEEEALHLLDLLCEGGWLAREGDGPAMSYRATLRRPPARRPSPDIRRLLDF
jgi:hypothetical protein